MHQVTLAATAVALAALLMACDSDVTTNGPTGSSGAGAGQSTAGPGGAGGNGQGGSGGAGQGGGAVCGGFAGASCPDTQYCDYPLNSCGATDGTGICTARPENCDTSLDPVCACDGMIYGNPCTAYGAGQDLSRLGGCTVDPGMFPCGPRICNAAAEFCRLVGSDGPNIPDEYTCEALPSPCNMMSVPNCTCMMPTADSCGGTCNQDGTTGGITISCPGG